MKRSENGPVFDAYAAYYDLLYRDKDYEGEADYVHRLIRRHRPGARSILEFGSGTGRHAGLLAAKGAKVHGIERSAVMLDTAARTVDARLRKRLSFSRGDIRTRRVHGKFDAVISLFHVISYLTENRDVLAAFRNARRHLKPGGVFVFDVWYGPAVTAQRPEVRVKEMSGEGIRVTRLCEPDWQPDRNRVDVNYRLFIRRDGSREVVELEEAHRMRYFFAPEIELFLSCAGFKLVGAEAWMTGQAPSPASWGVCFIAR